jgi:hypothetical protein
MLLICLVASVLPAAIIGMTVSPACSGGVP